MKKILKATDIERLENTSIASALGAMAGGGDAAPHSVNCGYCTANSTICGTNTCVGFTCTGFGVCCTGCTACTGQTCNKCTAGSCVAFSKM